MSAERENMQELFIRRKTDRSDCPFYGFRLVSKEIMKDMSNRGCALEHSADTPCFMLIKMELTPNWEKCKKFDRFEKQDRVKEILKNYSVVQRDFNLKANGFKWTNKIPLETWFSYFVKTKK